MILIFKFSKHPQIFGNMFTTISSQIFLVLNHLGLGCLVLAIWSFFDVPIFVTKVTEYLCSGGFFFADKFL